jgi:hypothetical protein
MAQHRVTLLKKWANMFGKEYPVGTILQTDDVLASELIGSKIAEVYTGPYPPVEKMKLDLKQLNNK